MAKIINLIQTAILVSLTSACSANDRGNFGPFKRSLNITSYGYSVIEDSTKTAPSQMIEVFDVRPGDCSSNSGWNDCEKDRERSELTEVDKDNYPGNEYWYGWSIYFPESYPNVYPTKVALGQFHQYQSHPAWMFQNSSGGYHLDNHIPSNTKKDYLLIDESELRGKWHRIEVHVRWTKDDKGFFSVWVNGEKKVDYHGATMTAQRVYFKYGVYRSFMSRYKNANNANFVPAQTAYFSNVKRSDDRKGLLPEAED
ncbi:hypothetical protein EOPP23_08935 [Endozoicomonas sp. OPT23]|uniref:polysaccharide lyase n=1 Tax=Endozoicomonas sp. OPT23 TaxID=2072845 RepID=UPI00129BCD57|nr:polysaccharide lyase [Endozoicomonas sp. OPT23]MRI33106.1 hypothetical protein [Endozoicomonas sp. OPT23]